MTTTSTLTSSKETNDGYELATFNLGEEDLSDDSDFECEINELMQPDALDDLDVPLDCEQENEELQEELKELADELMEWARLTNQSLDIADLFVSPKKILSSSNNAPVSENGDEKSKSPPSSRRASLRGNYHCYNYFSYSFYLLIYFVVQFNITF